MAGTAHASCVWPLLSTYQSSTDYSVRGWSLRRCRGSQPGKLGGEVNFSCNSPLTPILNFNVCKITGNLSLQFHAVEQQRNLQRWRRKDWVWHTRDQVTNLLEHILFQDLPRYEDWPAAQLCFHNEASWLPALTDCWRAIPRHLIGPWHVEDADWVGSVFAVEL